MTAVTQSRMNVVVTLVLPLAALAYLASGVSLPSSRFGAVAMTVGAVVWLATTVALNARGSHDVQGRVPPVAVPQSLPSVYPSYVKDLSRPVARRRSRSVLTAPAELLALTWTVPFAILLGMLPIGLALAGVVWVVRRVVGN